MIKAGILLATCLAVATAANLIRYPVCDTPCRTNGHVPTCCRCHRFEDGLCENGNAFCFNGEQVRNNTCNNSHPPPRQSTPAVDKKPEGFSDEQSDALGISLGSYRR